jgi:phage shock protein A
MGLFDRISRVVKANLNDLVSKAEDPEKILEQSIEEMKEDLVQLRQAVAQAIAAQKRTEQQYNQNQNEASKWERNARLALQKGDENLARQALERKKTYGETANTLKASLDQQVTQIDTLKRNLVALESKISEAKTKKDMLKARISAAKAQEQLQGTVGRLGTGSAMAAFERMEEKVLMQEARAQAAGELVGGDLESQFAALEAGSDVDDELAALKAQMSLGPATSPNQPSLPQANERSTTAKNQVVDAELDDLKKQLDQL